MPDSKVRYIDVVDMHTAGEPVRIVTGGYPVLNGASILDKRRDALANHDAFRRALMLEPRGHAGMYGVIPVQPSLPGADFACLFMHNEGYSTMCGHATIALGKWLVESGHVPRSEPETRFGLELPCGLVEVTAKVVDGKVKESAFVSVPAFLAARDVTVDVPGFGPVTGDLCYGGAYYLVLPARAAGLDFHAAPLAALVAAGTQITEAGRAQLSVDHPEDRDLGFLYGTILTDDAPAREASYNLCIFADGQIDRSPTGSGVTARMARDHARGLIAPGVKREFYGPTPVPFSAEIASTVNGGRDGAVRVRVSGTSAYCGSARFELHADDPLAWGFLLPETYGDLRAATPSS
ncbi:MAG TPA: proline racemase family protein [Beijerinckiaceae bacterium]|nr:proline racemase family protein [Beijerinckiaceae bacterium]